MTADVIKLTIVEPDGKKRRPGGGPPPAPPDDGDDASAIFGSHIDLGEKLKYALVPDWVFSHGQWFHWSGRHWQRDLTKHVWFIAKQICKQEGALCSEAKLARAIHSDPSIMAAVRIASVEREIACAMSEFDRDPWLFNTPDGILNLKAAGQLIPHDPSYKMTKIAGAGPMTANDVDEMSASGGCPLFLEYLNSATGRDEHLIAYLQRVAGYCLTGSIEEHCILFFHGPGGTGKTLFLLIIQDLLGDYAINAPMNAFTFTMGERHPTEMARMVGARVVTASEVDEGVRWDEGKLKAISGGDKITAHFMRQDDFTFEPQFKLLLAGNHRPRMRSADDAMRRRMHVIPFKHKPKEVDKQLREKLRKELPGILRWAVQGELMRQQLGGLNPPKLVQAATDDYFRDENTLGRWLDERCDLSPDLWASTRESYRDYTDWARGVGEFVLPERVFSQKLEQMPGVEKSLHPRSRIKGFRGLIPRFTTQTLPGVDQPLTEQSRSVRADEFPFDASRDDGASTDR